MPPDEGYPHARLVIDRALALDPRNADAYATRALIRVNYDRDWGGGAADIAKAQEFGGSRITYLPAAKIAGTNLLLRDRIDEAGLIGAEKDEAARQALPAAVGHARGRSRDSDAAIKHAIPAPAWAWAIAQAYAYRGDKLHAWSG